MSCVCVCEVGGRGEGWRGAAEAAGVLTCPAVWAGGAEWWGCVVHAACVEHGDARHCCRAVFDVCMVHAWLLACCCCCCLPGIPLCLRSLPPPLTCKAAVDLHLCLLFREALEARVGVHLGKPRVRLLAAAATGPAGSSSSSNIFLLLLFRHVVRDWAGTACDGKSNFQTELLGFFRRAPS